MLLLHLFAFLFPMRVRAIYIDHQLQDPSASWGQFVQDFALKQQIDCVICPVAVSQGNLESEARKSRYQAFQQHLQADEVLVLAHHQQDQAETVLLRLLSGAGVTGLGAMKAIDLRDDMMIWRPFLDLSRQQIETWATSIHLRHITDPTNIDTHFDRAWAREVLWPVLTARFPKMQTSIARTAILMQDAQDILAEVTQADLKACVQDEVLDITCFSDLSLARQRQVVSTWMMADTHYRPSFQMVDRLLNDVIHARVDAQTALFCKPYWYTRFQGKIYQLMPDQYRAKDLDIITETDIQFTMHCPVRVLSGDFTVLPKQKIGLSDQLLGQSLRLVTRQGGEKIHFYGRVGRWPLKKAIQDAHIFPWLRHRVQILYRDNAILGVFTPQGFWLAHSDACQQGGWLPKLCIS